jgi:hypothetical protein
MKGILKKTEQGWFVIYDQILGEGIIKRNQNALPLHPLDVKQIDEDSKVFDNIEARIKAYPDVKFEMVKEYINNHTNELQKYAKLINLNISDKSWEGCDGCTEQDEIMYKNGYAKGYNAAIAELPKEISDEKIIKLANEHILYNDSKRQWVIEGMKLYREQLKIKL